MYIRLFTGPMGSGKSAKLIEHYRINCNDRYNSLSFKPKIDTRDSDMISSRNGLCLKAIEICGFYDILGYIKNQKDLTYVYIDEIQFLDYKGLKVFVEYCIKEEISIICSGLDLTSELDVFKTTSYMMCYATYINKLTTMCDCGSHRKAKFTDCKIKKDNTVTIGGDDIYKYACEKCHSNLKEEK